MEQLIFHFLILFIVFQLLAQVFLLSNVGLLNYVQSGFSTFVEDIVEKDLVLEDVFMTRSKYDVNDKALVYFTVVNNIKKDYLIKVYWIHDGQKILGWEGNGFGTQMYNSWFFFPKDGEWEVLIEILSEDGKLITLEKKLFKVI